MTDHRQAHEGAVPMDAGPSGPLLGIRVVDLTRALAGPFCTMLLADLGADVIKVEPPEGDFPRFGGPFTEDDTERSYGGYFGSINRNKRGIVLDLHQADDREHLVALVDGADVLVENFRAGVMERLDLSYESLHRRNPRLVYAAIRGFGDPRTGRSPYVDWPAYDVVAQAMSGVVSTTGTAQGETVRVGPSVGDLYPATVAALGIVAGVLHARQTGQGQFLDVAMVDALVALCEAAVYRYSFTGFVTRPTGNSHPQLSPFDIYPTADGACAVAAPTPKHWELLCQAMGRPDLVDDDRARTNRERVANAAFVRQAVTEWTSARTTDAITQLLGGVVPVGPVRSAPDLFADEHQRARRMLVAMDHPGSARPVVYSGPPIKFTATPAAVWRRAPRLGEHTEEVLAELDRARAGPSPGRTFEDHRDRAGPHVRPDGGGPMRATFTAGGREHPSRLRRSELSTPGTSPAMMAKAAASGADLVFLDLEDAVAPSHKVGARASIVTALTTLDWGRTTRAVRVNGAHSRWCHGDVIDVVAGAGHHLDVLILPKVKAPRDVWFVDSLLAQLEDELGLEPGRIGLEVLIEETEALARVEEIAACSPRLEALILGVGDLSASQGMRLGHVGQGGGYPGDLWHYARNRMIVAARANGLDPVDGPFANFRDPEGYRTEAGWAATLGAVGKWAIHPSQVPIANQVFSPTPEEAERARAVVEAVRAAEAAGAGAANLGGMMIDAATARIFEGILARAEQARQADEG